ncbi:twitching motility protein PilT [Capsulimonas corticalis]|uniref:Twitching motility protein PilT n=1 Tax=Capsulimonas corticalis TaxID=2219043 RepID=A0A402CPU9_9BACT|nr:type IV pilus twitching motility protein PilT [Capsulimonas corticalis]BDI32975.1 twitching motility protein PilT [Capsulimonas corticalis]
MSETIGGQGQQPPYNRQPGVPQPGAQQRGGYAPQPQNGGGGYAPPPGQQPPQQGGYAPPTQPGYSQGVPGMEQMAAPQVKKKPIDQIHLDELLEIIIDMGGSDLHIAAGIPPVVRANGALVPTMYENCTPMDVQQMMYAILTDEQIQKFESTWELDFSYALQKRARFRVNIYKDKGAVAASLRLIPTKIPSLQDLQLPAIVEKLTHTKRGLILVTGPTGSGKSTTLAAMINHINTSRSEHVITIEDPIEYLHSHKMSVINQRELGSDTKSFPNALRACLREDPDIILVGEMRDLDTMQLAISAAETGHLVFATLHTNSAATSVDRIVDGFPPGQQSQVRLQLSNNIQAIIAQQLIPRANGQGRVAVQEIMIATPAIRNLIREAKAHQITSAIQTSGNVGMITTDQALRDHYMRGNISYESATSRAHNLEELKKMLAIDASESGSGGSGPAGYQRPQR